MFVSFPPIVPMTVFAVDVTVPIPCPIWTGCPGGLGKRQGIAIYRRERQAPLKTANFLSLCIIIEIVATSNWCGRQSLRTILEPSGGHTGSANLYRLTASGAGGGARCPKVEKRAGRVVRKPKTKSRATGRGFTSKFIV